MKHDPHRRLADVTRAAKTGWGARQSRIASAMSVILTGDAFLALEEGPQGEHKPGPKPNRQRKPITLPKIGAPK